MFILSNFRVGLLEYLQVSIIGLQRKTFFEALDSARTTEEGLQKPLLQGLQPNSTSTSTGKNPWRDMKCTSCERMGHEWVTCYQNPACAYGKKTKAALVHQIQTQSTTTPVSTDTWGNSCIGTLVQWYPCNVCRSLIHSGHQCRLLMDNNVKNAIWKKLPQTPGSSIVITDVHTVDVSHVWPRTQGQPHRQDPAVPEDYTRTTKVPHATDAFDWHTQLKVREEMIQTVRDL